MRVAEWNPQKANPEIMNASVDVLERVAEMIADSARGNVPVGKDVISSRKWVAREAGALRKSIRVVRLRNSNARNVRVYAGSYDVFYARFVEKGTVKMQARRFLEKALRTSRARAKAMLLGGG